MERVLKTMSVYFKELNTGSAASDADEIPDVQETVTMIPGSTLLWRITPRPPHSDLVTSPFLSFWLCKDCSAFIISARHVLCAQKYSWMHEHFLILP